MRLKFMVHGGDALGVGYVVLEEWDVQFEKWRLRMVFISMTIR